ncbi:unnamed protein product [Brassica oleracea]
MHNVKRVHWCLRFYFYREDISSYSEKIGCNCQNEQPSFVADH